MPLRKCGGLQHGNLSQQTWEDGPRPGAKRDRHYYGIKDAAMAKDASCGFMLWDGISKGTLSNVINVLRAQKKTLLYMSPRKAFFKLRTFEDFQQALHANGIENVPSFLASLGMQGATSPPLTTLG
jgi:hypothetical protein